MQAKRRNEAKINEPPFVQPLKAVLQRFGLTAVSAFSLDKSINDDIKDNV